MLSHPISQQENTLISTSITGIFKTYVSKCNRKEDLIFFFLPIQPGNRTQHFGTKGHLLNPNLLYLSKVPCDLLCHPNSLSSMKQIQDKDTGSSESPRIY
ncbi:hypothetical protein FKM82_016997 [Ascaphus truei]